MIQKSVAFISDFFVVYCREYHYETYRAFGRRENYTPV